MSTAFDKTGRMYRDVRHARATQRGWEWQFFWVRDRRQLLHKGRKP